jgi:hypothetical protein
VVLKRRAGPAESGVVGYTSAGFNAEKLLEQWDVDRNRSILIGSVVVED